MKTYSQFQAGLCCLLAGASNNLVKASRNAAPVGSVSTCDAVGSVDRTAVIAAFQSKQKQKENENRVKRSSPSLSSCFARLMTRTTDQGPRD